MIKKWLLVLLAGAACWGSLSAQVFVNPVSGVENLDGTQFIYSGVYSYPGSEEKWAVREDWAVLSPGEARRTSYFRTNSGWEFSASKYFKDNKWVSTLYPSDYGDYTHIAIEQHYDPNTNVALGTVLHDSITYEEWDIDPSLLYVTVLETYECTLDGVEIVDTPVGPLPAIRIKVSSHIAVTYADWIGEEPFSYEYSYTWWNVPGLGEVKYDGSIPEEGISDTYELKEINFDFKPEPLAILDGDNPIWNMLGYTWNTGTHWEYSFEFGSAYTEHWPTVYLSDSQAWLYLSGDRYSLWIWDYARARWVWSKQAVWPWYYDTVTKRWQYGL